MRTLPAAGRTSSRIALISVVLPAPFGPTIAISTPGGTVKSTSQSTGVAPYATVRSATSMAGTSAIGHLACQSRDDRVDVVSDHPDVHPLRRIRVAHRVREQAASDSDVEAARANGLLDGFDRPRRHGRLHEDGRDPALDDELRQILDVT